MEKTQRIIFESEKLGRNKLCFVAYKIDGNLKQYSLNWHSKEMGFFWGDYFPHPMSTSKADVISIYRMKLDMQNHSDKRSDAELIKILNNDVDCKHLVMNPICT